METRRESTPDREGGDCVRDATDRPSVPLSEVRALVLWVARQWRATGEDSAGACANDLETAFRRFAEYHGDRRLMQWNMYRQTDESK